MKQVWKLQRPIFATDGALNEVMAYPEDRKSLAIIPMPLEDVDLLFEDELKIYVLGEVRGGNLIVDHKVDEEDW